MPKNADETKLKMRLKSTRKPLHDVSNAKKGIKSANIHNKISGDDRGHAGDDSLDRFLLVHSDLSTLIRQIDELVVQALQLKGNEGRKEIKQFADVLSDMQNSLKPWVSRFQQAIIGQSTGSDNKSEQPEERIANAVSKECTNTAVESPEVTKWESHVSPSPLQPWVSRSQKAIIGQSTGSDNKSEQPEERKANAVSKECTNTAVECPEVTKWESLVSPSPLQPWVSRSKKAIISRSTGPDNKSEQPEERKALGVSKECTNTAVESPELTKWESPFSPSPLQPWVSRSKKAIISQSTGPDNKSEQPEERKALGVSKECTDTAVESPEVTKWVSLVSPSPLVSWRAGCNMENGRQLFLLTPLPQKKASSFKDEETSLHAFKKIPSDEVAHPLSLSNPVRNLGNDLHEGASAKPTPKMAFNIEMTKAVVDNLQTDCASPERVSSKNCSQFIMTPCMKMSPPKSCILLEPVSAFSGKKNYVVHKATPFPTGVHSYSESEDSEFSSDQSSDDMKLNYPEFYGIKKDNLHSKIETEDSPNWIVSPPKTCVLMMDPSNEPMLKTTAVSNQEGDFSTITTNDHGNSSTTSKNDLQGIIRTLDLAEFTPMVKEPMSSFRMGKHPGENTLKKELWTRFEAASTDVTVTDVNSYLFRKTAKKGFLDILDEASTDA